MPKEFLLSVAKDPIARAKMLLRSRTGFKNFGDELSPLILAMVTGKSVTWAAPEEADVYSIGSILQYLPIGSVDSKDIWGAGIREANPKARGDFMNHNFIATRGPLTASSVGAGESYGDPGLLISSLFPATKNRTNTPVYIPHFSEIGTKSGDEAASRFHALGFKVISPTEAPANVAHEVARASYVATSSLHGLVTSDAYGIPRIRLALDNEPVFKYLDYGLAIGHNDESLVLRDFISGIEKRTFKSNSFEPVSAQKIELITNSLFESSKKLS
jgi:pyruvyltransferase